MIHGVCAQKALANDLEFERYQDTVSASFGGTKEEVPWEYEKRSAEFHAEKLTMPIALWCGGKDESVPCASVLRLAEKLKQLGRNVFLIYRPDATHRASYEDTVETIEWTIDVVTCEPA